jgi:hypothetical protein
MAAEKKLTPCGKVGEIAMWSAFIGGSGATPDDLIAGIRQPKPELFDGIPKNDAELRSMVVEIQQLRIPVATSASKVTAAMTKAMWYGKYYRMRCELESQNTSVKTLLESVPEIEYCSKIKKANLQTYETCLLPRMKVQAN